MNTTAPTAASRVSVFFPHLQPPPASEAAQLPALRRARTCAGSSARVAVLKSEESRLDAMADPSFMAGLENEDPRALAGFMRKMSDEMGEPLDA
jgi:hypothetical protein